MAASLVRSEIGTVGIAPGTLLLNTSDDFAVITGSGYLNKIGPVSGANPKPTDFVFANYGDGNGLFTISVSNGLFTLVPVTESITGGTSLGGTDAIYAGVSGNDLTFKGLTAGSNITLTPSSTDITIASTASGTVNAGTTGQIAYYASNGTAVSGETTVPVANGGTGDNSATPYAVLTGGTTSTGPFQSIASVGTALQFLMSNGPSALPNMKSMSLNVQDFYTNGTYTPSANCAYAIIYCVGGGGGSGGVVAQGAGQAASSGGGGGGAYVQHLFISPTTQTVTVGAGGAAGANTGTNGGTGGTTSFGSLCSALGGSGGGGINGTFSTFVTIGGGNGGLQGITPNMFISDGQPGNPGYACGSIGMNIPGEGGAAFLFGAAANNGATSGNIYGGGAPGINVYNGAAKAGLVGGPGACSVFEYIYS